MVIVLHLRDRGPGSRQFDDASGSLVGHGCTTNLLDLGAETLRMAAFVDSTDLESDQAGAGILQQPVRRLSPLESSPHDPSPRNADETQCDRLCGIFRDPIPVKLIDTARR